MNPILIIDDSRSILEFVHRTLADAGFPVITANSGKSGLESLRSEELSLVITDIYMPEFDGIEIIREAGKTQADTPIIAMSSKQGAMNVLPAARVLGARNILPKPFSEIQLLDTVKAALEKGHENHNRSRV